MASFSQINYTQAYVSLASLLPQISHVQFQALMFRAQKVDRTHLCGSGALCLKLHAVLI